MLFKLTNHLRNIALFKSCLYVLVIALLITLIPIFQSELEESSSDNRIAHDNLIETARKLQLIGESKEKLLDTIRRYKNTLGKSAQDNCKNKSEIINQVMKLTQEYALLHDIKIQISPVDKKQIIEIDNSQVGIRNFLAKINYLAPNLKIALDIADKIYGLMPTNTQILTMKIEDDIVLSPDNLSKLTDSNTANFVNCNIEMQIREISINKNKP